MRRASRGRAAAAAEGCDVEDWPPAAALWAVVVAEAPWPGFAVGAGVAEVVAPLVCGGTDDMVVMLGGWAQLISWTRSMEERVGPAANGGAAAAHG